MTEEKPKVEIKAVRQEIKDIKVVLQEPIPTYYADGMVGMGLQGNSVRMNFCEDKFNPSDGGYTRHIIFRLALPLEIFYSFADIVKQVRDQSEAVIAESKAALESEAKDGK